MLSRWRGGAQVQCTTVATVVAGCGPPSVCPVYVVPEPGCMEGDTRVDNVCLTILPMFPYKQDTIGLPVSLACGSMV
jgi:hypothetical protein